MKGIKMEISMTELLVLVKAAHNPLAVVSDASTLFWEVGKNYFIRTVTHHYTGKCVGFNATEIILENAAWIADDGRFAQAVASCEFSEVEPFPAGKRVLIGRAVILDATEIEVIPTNQK
jgi:hypothetical protein